jgi:5-methylcytosine-specific restriction endonuclease McrA
MQSPAAPYYRSKHWRDLRDRCLRRDRFRCRVEGCPQQGKVADHIVARAPVPYPTAADVISNLRTLCLSHDAQVKEERRGVALRKQGGRFKVRGCDADGWPLDPGHR